MTTTPVAPQFSPVHIGEEAKPPLAILPNPDTLFAARAARFRALAPYHQLKDYLTLLAGVAEAQAAILPELPAVAAPQGEAVERALDYGMAPIARAAQPVDATMLATLDALLARLGGLAMPSQARAALDGLIAASEAERHAMIANVLSDAIPAQEIVEHVFAGAAMQVHFARLAALLPADRLTPVTDGACPACGGPPVSSSVVGWEGANSTRFVACAACATRWHVVRVKCVACSSTKGIHYAHVEGTSDTIKAECCDECRTYLKIMSNISDPDLDPVADDVASAGLDLMVQEQGYRRSGFNIYLAGF